jgi:hypothetical protein
VIEIFLLDYSKDKQKRRRRGRAPTLLSIKCPDQRIDYYEKKPSMIRKENGWENKNT